MTPECERFEVEIGMREHGALDAREEAALDAHLQGCASCRRFAMTSGRMTQVLGRQVERESQQIDWAGLERAVHRLRRSARLKLILAPLLLLQLPVTFLLATGHLPDARTLAIVPAANVLLYLAYVWLVNRPFREVMAVVRTGEDLVRGYTRELERQRLRARIFVVVNSVLVLGSIAGAVVDRGVGVLYSVACVLGFGGWAAYDLFFKLPRLRRALAEVRR